PRFFARIRFGLRCATNGLVGGWPVTTKSNLLTGYDARANSSSGSQFFFGQEGAGPEPSALSVSEVRYPRLFRVRRVVFRFPADAEDAQAEVQCDGVGPAVAVHHERLRRLHFPSGGVADVAL